MPTIVIPVPLKRTIDPNCAVTVHEFCALEGLSMYQYRRLRELGFGPRERYLPGLSLPQITPEARAQWHKDMEKRKSQNQIKRERKRRSEFFKRLSKQSLLSSKHVSHRQAKPKQSPQPKA